MGEVDGRVAGWTALMRWSARAGYARRPKPRSTSPPTRSARAWPGAALRPPALGARRDAQICAENAGGLALAASLGFARVGTLHEVGHKFGRVLDVALCERLV